MILTVSTVMYGQSTSDLISSERPFSVGAKVVAENTNRYEIGSLNGVAYRFSYANGSGVFEGLPGNGIETGYKPGRDFLDSWFTGCEKDHIDDSKLCFMHRENLWISVDPRGSAVVWIGADHFPGSGIAIRIDGRPAIRSRNAEFTALQTKQIIQQLKSGRQVTTRFQEFPNNFSTDKTFATYGFSEAFSFINWAITKIK
jgi:hypothetical protein